MEAQREMDVAGSRGATFAVLHDVFSFLLYEAYDPAACEAVLGLL